MFIRKKLSCCFATVLSFLLISFNMINSIAKDFVTERELLMLSIMSYSNNQKENVCEMIDDENFNKKWFCGYTDASELVGWKMVDCSISKNNDDKDGFSVVCYKKEDNLVIAFRGTDNGVVSENWNYILPYTEHPQAKYVREYIEKIKKANFIDSKTKIYCTGHSLGGYLTLYGVGVMLQSDYFKDKFVRAITFNGLGLGYVKDDNIIKELSSLDDSKLTNYRIYGDVVSTIGKHFTKFKTLQFINNKNNSGVQTKILRNPHFPHHFFAQSPFCL